MSATAEGFVSELAERLAGEPDLDDFLSWRGGTLEYWLQLVTIGVARRHGWVADTEIPYVTGRPSSRSRSNVKLADVVAHLGDGGGALFEVKTVAVRQGRVGDRIGSLVDDMAALLATDWNATCQHSPTNHPDPEWWERRLAMSPVDAFQLTLVHGSRPFPDPRDVYEQVYAGVEGRVSVLGAGGPEECTQSWLNETARALDEPLAVHEIEGPCSAGVLYAWRGVIVSG